MSAESSIAEMHELDMGGLMLDAGSLAFIISDTTGADVLGGDSPDGR
jgi:hypothetical protein